MYHIPTQKDMVFIADSQFTVSTTPSTRVISFIGSCMNPFTELCLLNKSMKPPPPKPKVRSKTKLVKLKGLFCFFYVSSRKVSPRDGVSLQPWREAVDNTALMFLRVRACCIVAA